MKNKTLIYIIGAGRSGTTLLDIVLGNNENTISLGEINRYYKRNGIPPKRNENDKVSLFWNKITLRLKDQVLSFTQLNSLFEKNEYHTKFFKSLLKQNQIEYKNALSFQYTVANKEIKESILIESSKYPVRALNLSNYLDNQSLSIKYIYLKKDPVRVIKSFQKKGLEQPSKGYFAANIYYFCVNILCRYVIYVLKKRKHKISIIKYEDLLLDTDNTIQKLSNDLDLNFSFLEKKLKKKEALNTGFLFDGNRIRLNKNLTLNPLSEIEKKGSKYYFTRMFNYIIYR